MSFQASSPKVVPTIGAITAGKVIEVVGTTFGEDAWKDIYRLVSKVKHEKYLF